MTLRGVFTPQLLTLPRSRFLEKWNVVPTQVEAVVGREYLMGALPSQATHLERCHARSTLHALLEEKMALLCV